jgi:hypothetical protein|mmetsp:Transcript_32291/g.109770  ORF Transcript_32291/g.109770 Transcript_32291/m.109770 type:complete len:104 (+) Transcript_32291:65-376(+)
MALRALSRTVPALAQTGTKTPVRWGGGGAHPPAPAHVWTPAGGWFVDPPNWKTNLGYAFGVLVFSGVCMFRISIKMEERPVAPKHNIPAQKWANVPPTDRDHW